MNNFLTNKINGWHYIGILFCFRIIIVLIADAINYTNDAGAKIVGLMATLPFLAVLLFFAYYRAKRINNDIGGLYYTYIVSMIFVLMFGSFEEYNQLNNSGQLDILSETNKFLYWGFTLSPIAGIYAIFYNAFLIFRNATVKNL